VGIFHTLSVARTAFEMVNRQSGIVVWSLEGRVGMEFPELVTGGTFMGSLSKAEGKSRRLKNHSGSNGPKLEEARFQARSERPRELA
jgi:hypothetical protein